MAAKPPAKPGRKITGRQAAIALGVAGLLVVGYVLYRRRQAASTAATTSVPGGDVGAGGTLPYDLSGLGLGSGSGGGGGVLSPPPPTDTTGGGVSGGDVGGTTGGGSSSTITVWVHGNPGHPATVTVTGSGPQWVNVGGQWLYVVPGSITGSGGNTWAGQAYTTADAPPGAGSPPGGAASTLQGQAAAALPTGTVGQVASYLSEPAGAVVGATTPNTQTSRWAAASQLSSPAPPAYPVVGSRTGGPG